MANHVVPRNKEHKTEVAQPEPASEYWFTPRVDIFESEDELTLYADLPGVKADDVDIRFEKGQLVLHGRCWPRQRGVSYHACEYGVGDFYRVFSVNEDVETKKISAELNGGVLVVHLPKTEAAKPRRIPVKGE
jgi:HSP20 family molecular chaperone IbpA